MISHYYGRLQERKAIIIRVIAVLAPVFMIFTSCNKDPKQPAREYMPDMYRSQAYKENSINPNFTDSMSSRKPVQGTIPRGINHLVYPYPNTNDGYEAAGREFKNPLAQSPENLAEGKRLYDIFCIHCHDPEGKGDGTIVQNGKFPPVPSYSGPMLVNLPVGKMYHSITYGKNMMGSHASQLLPEERWKIVMHIQTLQKPGVPAAAPADSATNK